MIACACGCHRPAAELHHAFYRQALRRYNGDVNDAANLVPLSRECHERHHNASRRLTLHVLPDDVFLFGRELMGPGAAYEYLVRYYRGTDERLERLLQEWTSQESGRALGADGES